MAASAILIAEKNRRVGEFLAREFSRSGHHTRTVKDGWELMLTLRSGAVPDVLVLDPDLASRHGEGLARHVAREFPQVRLVLHAIEDIHGGASSVRIVGKGDASAGSSHTGLGPQGTGDDRPENPPDVRSDDAPPLVVRRTGEVSPLLDVVHDLLHTRATG